MAQHEKLSVSKLVAAVGGALLVAAFFLPVVDVKAGGAAARDMFGVKAMRQEIERSRDLSLVQPLIEPALKSYEAFAETPSLRNLSAVCGVTKEILETTLTLPIPHRTDVEIAVGILKVVRPVMWLLPLVGLIQLVLPLATIRRGHAGFVGLVSRFWFGLILLLMALIPVLGVSDAERPFIGSGVYALLAGAAAMVGAGVFGVTRQNWWYVFLVQGLLFVGLIAFIVLAVQTASQAM